MKNKITSLLRENRILLLIILISVLVSVFFGFRKEGMFLDELYSYGLSNSHYAPFVENIKGGNFIDKVITNDELSDYITVAKGEGFNYGSVYYNQSQDVHPPLFYMLLHTVCSFFPGMFSKWFGLGLNMAIFALTLIMLYKTSELIFNNKNVSCIAALFYGLSHAALSTVNMIRMYMLLAFFTVLLAYFILKFLRQKKWQSCLAIGLTIFLGLFTQYYFVFYAFFVCATVVIYLLAKKDIKNAAIFGISAILGVLLMYLCYPFCIQHLFADKVVSGGSAVDNLTNLSIYAGRIKHFTTDLIDSMIIAVIISVLMAVVILLGRRKKTISCEEKDTRTKVLLLFVPALLTHILAAIISPYLIIRYIYNIIPILMLIPAYIAYRMLSVKNNDKKWFFGTVTAIALVAAVTLTIQGPTWLYRNYTAYDEVMEKQEGKLCVYMTQNADYGIVSDLPQLLNFDEIFVTDDVDSEALYEYMEKQEKDKGVVVYIAEDLEMENVTHEEILSEFEEKYGYSDYSLLFDGKDFSVAYLVE